MTDDNKASGDDQRALIKFLLENRSTVNYLSILMIIYAVWATIEVLTNAAGATWWPPETGIPASELFNNPSSSQNINNGWVIALGAIFGTVGIMVQYFYRAAPYVDASMQATAALIISAVKEVGVDIPIVVRLKGNNADIAQKILTESNLNIIFESDLSNAAKKVVELSI